VKKSGLALVALSLLVGCSDPGGDRVAGAAAAGAVDRPSGNAPADPPPEASAENTRASARFDLGSDYFRLTPVQPTATGPDQVEVIEVFAYDCAECYELDRLLSAWVASAPDYVSFRRLASVSTPQRMLHARALFAAQAIIGDAEETHERFFREIQSNGNPLDSTESLAAFFGRLGIETEQFQATFESFEVHRRLQQADELNRRYRITDVPSIVINGKYTTNLASAGSYETLIDILSDLTASENTFNE
jgi:thiol:disulfide interchange protein DsbA